jgi:hypothetical protein
VRGPYEALRAEEVAQVETPLGPDDESILAVGRHFRVGSYLAVKGSGESRPMLGVEQTQNDAKEDRSNTRIMCVMENL